MMAEVLDACLGEYASRGFYLEEDDHILRLYHLGTLVARFGALGATVQEVRNACQQHLSGESLAVSKGS